MKNNSLKSGTFSVKSYFCATRIYMRTKSIKKNKINVITLGCSKNLYDSEVLMGQLKANGKEVEHEGEGECSCYQHLWFY